MFLQKPVTRLLGGLLGIGLAFTFLAVTFSRRPFAQAAQAGVGNAASQQETMKQAYRQLPMSFELNQGQADEAIKFLARGHGYQVFLTNTEAVLALANNPQSELQKSSFLKFKLQGARDAAIAPSEPLPGKSNYLMGNDASRWRTNIPNYARVQYSEVYPGIAMAFYGTQRALEYDFVVAPGADSSNIAFAIEGADKIELDDNGDLVLRVGGQRVFHRAPVSYQNIAGKRRVVNSRYVLKGSNLIGFEVPSYDKQQPLVIDPVVDFSTFFGGIGSDEGFAIAVDATGAAYVTGTTYSNNFNTFAPLQTINRGGKFDAFITKINPTGSAIVYSTYLGGSGEDQGRGIAVNANGEAFIAGITNSLDFNTRNALQGTISGLAEDAFVTKVNAEGTDLLFSTYLGGSNIDQAFAIVLGSGGDAYVAGSTVSTNFPTRTPLQATNRGNADVFVTRIKGDGTQLVYSTYLGGSGFDEAYGIALDAGGNAYVTGSTASVDFNTLNPFQPANAGAGSDVFLARINAAGSALVYSTYLGGTGVDVAYGVAVDANQTAFVTGHTFSTNFPTQNPLQATNRGEADAFVARFNATGSALIYSTYLGGAQGDFGRGIVVDSGSQPIVTGRTASTDFNVSNPLQATNRGNVDAFVSKLNINGNQLVYSTYLGGTSEDLAYGIAIDSAGAVYITGDALSTDFNTRNALQTANRGGFDAFVTKINPAGSDLAYSTYLGGSGEDLASGIALDLAGNAYITGYTSSNDYATISPIQATSRGGLEAFVTKIFADASSIAFNTYFGGNGSDVANAIAVDTGGNCYITGSTTSTNFPTRTPFQANNRGGLDVFIAKFNSLGTNIIYSTYLGGQFGEVGRGIAVDAAGNAWIAGGTFSDDFPVASAFQPTSRGSGDAFVARINSAGSGLIYSSFLGGGNTDEAAAVRIDSAGNAYVVGNTASTDFNTQNPLQATNRGQRDAFVSKIAPEGTSLVYSTYLGGQRADIGNGIALDSANNVYITGSTASFNFPLIAPLQVSYGGGDLDSFVTKINAAGSALSYSTYLGGLLNEVGNSIAVDSFGNAYVTGVTASTNFPLRNPIQSDNRGGNEVFISKLNPQGSTFVYSTYLGGSGTDQGSGVAVDALGTAYVTGSTGSANFNIQFPLLAYGGGADVFVAKLISEASLTLTPSTLELAAGSSTSITVTISAAQNQAVTVSLLSSNGNLVSVPASVTIPANTTSTTFTAMGVALGGPVTITASLPQAQGGATATTSVTVITSNRFLNAANVQAVANSGVIVPFDLVSQGDENRLAFSITINSAALLSPQFTLGGDTASAGATLSMNTTQAASGRYGVTINLPTNQKLIAGTRQVLVLSAVVLGAGNSTIVFGDSPTVRRIADINNNTLSTNYTNGSVSVSTGFEGDVAPRPNGSNGTVTIADWVQTGRFAAGFDTATPGSEFQRADTSPRSSLGNGSITISDWVQTGRYASGLDPLAPAGGPTGESLNAECGMMNAECNQALRNIHPSSFSLPDSAQQSRVARITNVTAQRGQQFTAFVEIDSQGNENGFGFSVSFDTTNLNYVSSALGSDASGATLNVNTTQAAAGRLGFALALPTGQPLAAGNSRRLIALTFSVPANGTTNSIPITFGDQPIVREVVNANADTLTVIWNAGAVTVARAVTSVSAASFAGGDLSAEQIVAAFGSSLATSTQVATTIPLPTTLVGTTVRIRDNNGVNRSAPLFFVAPSQVNYLVPTGTANGAATVTITSGDGSISVGTVNITAVSPGLFTANSTGAGIAAATVFRLKADGATSFEPVVRFDAALGRLVPVPIDLGPESDQVILLLFGTAFRNNTGLPLTATIGGLNSEVLYAGPQGDFVGLDQANIRIPRSAIGRGEVNVVFTVGTRTANTVTLTIK
ncbi:MAG: SBBP repeat-containing protein [Blastocatellia bacterium]